MFNPLPKTSLWGCHFSPTQSNSTNTQQYSPFQDVCRETQPNKKRETGKREGLLHTTKTTLLNISFAQKTTQNYSWSMKTTFARPKSNIPECESKKPQSPHAIDLNMRYIHPLTASHQGKCSLDVFIFPTPKKTRNSVRASSSSPEMQPSQSIVFESHTEEFPLRHS